MKRLLLTGASGFLGAHVLQAALHWHVAPTYFSHAIAHLNARRLDVRDATAVDAMVKDFWPEAIIHTACSNGSAEEIASITAGARAIAAAARRHGARLVHLSSDIIFDGEHAPYADEARPSPVTDYARAKAEAEAIVAEMCPEAVIVRPSLIWSLNPLDHQTGWLVRGLERGEQITLFTDEWRCPVHVTDVAAALLELAARPDIAGPFNFGGPQAYNRWEFGNKMLAALNIAPGLNLISGTVRGSGLVRARDLTMMSVRATALLKTKLRAVDDVLGQKK
jgi:dTDP-4-dehydrorhamnose reductase